MNKPFVIFLITISIWLTACDRLPGKQSAPKADDTSQTESAIEELQKLYSDAKDKVPSPQQAVEWAKEDVNRYGDWQYKVTLITEQDTSKVETALNEIGRDRWQVFWINETDDGLMIFAKKPVKSILRALPIGEISSGIRGNNE
ncbi:MAG: hypothetical protein HKM24_08150 [Gammaproteobacteria bacterium]|nr:hypothetical protein [Gammaproteobacteria bacterium]